MNIHGVPISVDYLKRTSVNIEVLKTAAQLTLAQDNNNREAVARIPC